MESKKCWTFIYACEKDVLNPDFKHKNPFLKYDVFKSKNKYVIQGTYSEIDIDIFIMKIKAVMDKIENKEWIDYTKNYEVRELDDEVLKSGVLLRNTITEEILEELYLQKMIEKIKGKEDE